MRRAPAPALILLLVALPAPGLAVDPLYEPQTGAAERRCWGASISSTRYASRGQGLAGEMAELIALDQPDDDRKQRLAGAFNDGYQAYARLYRRCTPSAQRR